MAALLLAREPGGAQQRAELVLVEDAGAGDEARKVLGHLYFRKGNYEQARLYYEAVLKNDPNNEEIRGTFNATLKKLGSPK